MLRATTLSGCAKLARAQRHGAALRPVAPRVQRASRLLCISSAVELPPPPAPLLAGEVHLWWMDMRDTTARQCRHARAVSSADLARCLQEPRLLDAYRALLSPAELESAEGATASPEVRTERLLSKALARVTLARYAGSHPAVRPHARAPRIFRAACSDAAAA